MLVNKVMDLGLQTQAVNDECKPMVLVMLSKDANHFVVFKPKSKLTNLVHWCAICLVYLCCVWV